MSGHFKSEDDFNCNYCPHNYYVRGNFCACPQCGQELKRDADAQRAKEDARKNAEWERIKAKRRPLPPGFVFRTAGNLCNYPPPSRDDG